MWMDRVGEGSPQMRGVCSLVLEANKMIHTGLTVVVEPEGKSGSLDGNCGCVMGTGVQVV